MSALSTKENQFLKLARMHPEGLTDSIIETELPHFELDDVVNVANSLSSKSLIQLMRQGTGIVYKAKTDDEAKKMSVMDNDERIIYQHIEAADNEGIWLKRIKARVGLPSTTVTRCVKRLEQKLLIKAVTSVKNPTQKIYMLYDLTPSVELTGGPWYTDQELDVDFIETLSTQCYKFILSRSFPSNKPGAVYGPEHSFYPTAGQVRRFIMEMAISTVDLSVSDVQTLLSVLVYDGKVERLLPAAEHMDWDSDDEAPTNVGIGAKGKQAGKKEADYMYKAIRNKSAQNALVTIPCGQCPVYNDCCEGGTVSPTTCVYYKNWLDF